MADRGTLSTPGSSLLQGVYQNLETHIGLREAFLILIGVKPKSPKKRDDPELDADGWPKRRSDPTYLGDGPWGA